MRVIVPCCGNSSRYPGRPPKWTLPGPDGRPMLAMAIAKLGFALEDLMVVVLREHEVKYEVRSGLEAFFGRPVRVVILNEPTGSQAETVARAIEQDPFSGGFLVKDSDNVFELDEIEQDYNYVCSESIANFEALNPRNKSYIQINDQGFLTNIREKQIISDRFCVGGYFFCRPDVYLRHFERVSRFTSVGAREIYISDVVGSMMLDGLPFRSRSVTAYEDWGTLREWRRSMLARRLYIVALDGFLFERGADHLFPKLADARPVPQAVEAVRALAAHGHAITYMSVRPESSAPETEMQIRSAGLPAGPVVYGRPIGGWTLLTAPDPTIPFRISDALELSPDDSALIAKLSAGELSYIGRPET